MCILGVLRRGRACSPILSLLARVLPGITLIGRYGALWRAALVERATKTLEQELDALGKGKYFAVFRDYFLSSGPDVDYAELAERYELYKEVGDYENETGEWAARIFTLPSEESNVTASGY